MLEVPGELHDSSGSWVGFGNGQSSGLDLSVAALLLCSAGFI